MQLGTGYLSQQKMFFMRPSDVPLANEIKGKLNLFRDQYPLPGINFPERLQSLTLQIIDSIRRIKYITVIRDKRQSQIYTNPASEYFDPIKAAIWHIQHGNYNEAFWLVFLLTHFGKNKKTKWSLIRGVYGALGQHAIWTWENTCSNFIGFRNWLHQNQSELKTLGSFGNHRKYQSLDAFKLLGTGSAIGSYIEWVGPQHDHQALVATMQAKANTRQLLFKKLYDSMEDVLSFGRMAKFDYLTMIGKLELAPIEPDSTYMDGATGPKAGAQLLFYGKKNVGASTAELNSLISHLDLHLGLYFGMQVLEDALCNWQKDPDNYVHFIG